VSAPASQVQDLRLSLDRYLSIEMGADLTYAAAFGAGELEARYFPQLAGRPWVGAPLRLTRAVLFDAPVAWWLTVLQHEAFGHGGRAREFGSEAGVHMGSPWDGRSSYATFSTEGLNTEDLLRVYAGGTESNGRAATLLERELVAGRAMTSFELLYLASSRVVTSKYVLHTTPDPVEEPSRFYGEWQGGGDVANYLGYLNEIYYGDPGITPDEVSPSVIEEYRRLERQAWWNLADPGIWLSLYEVGRQVVRGDGAHLPPLPRTAGRTWLPVLSSDWMPDGGAVSLETVIGARADSGDDGPRWFSFTVRRGDGPAGPYGAVGAATETLFHTGLLRIGGEVELWNGSDRSFGGGVRVRFRFARGKMAGFFLDVCAKTDGHWPGRPAEPGLFLRLGSHLGPIRRAARAE
jgi:hypothetical protein